MFQKASKITGDREPIVPENGTVAAVGGKYVGKPTVVLDTPPGQNTPTIFHVGKHDFSNGHYYWSIGMYDHLITTGFSAIIIMIIGRITQLSYSCVSSPRGFCKQIVPAVKMAPPETTDVKQQTVPISLG